MRLFNDTGHSNLYERGITVHDLKGLRKNSRLTRNTRNPNDVVAEAYLTFKRVMVR